MTALAARVLRSVKARALVSPGDRIVVALSGGADSVALVHLLREVAPSLEATVAGIAHLNHQLRGTDADGDQAFAAALAERLGLPFFTASENVAARAHEAGVSIEQAGHEARRTFYASVLGASGASRVATGHTADDQAETVLLRLIRGAGTKGLGGIHAAQGRVFRPLIDITRAELRRYLARGRIEWRNDATNDDPAIARNRVRLELMPLLGARFSPAIVRTLARAADLLRDDESYLEGAATAAAASVVLEDAAGVSFDRRRLGALHPALGRRVVRHGLRALGCGGAMGARHVDQVLSLARSPRDAGEVVLPGATAKVTGRRLSMRSGPVVGRRRAAQAPPPFQPVALAIPGETDVPALGVRVSATWMTRSAADAVLEEGGTPDMVVLIPSAASSGLFVRARRPGDRLRPSGRGGSRKLQDLFVDCKVPRAERDRVPVVVDASDEVVWVVGCAVSEAATARGSVSSVLLLRVKGPGG